MLRIRLLFDSPAAELGLASSTNDPRFDERMPQKADWEPAHAVAELRRHGQYRVESVGLASAPVQSISHDPAYDETAHYVVAPAVRDRGLITASGLGDVEFARELFEELDVLSAEDRTAWALIFRSARLPEGSG